MNGKIYTDLIGIQRDMLKILGEVSSLTSNPLAIEDAIDDVWHPKCDVYITDSEWVIVVELAGMEKNEISISLTEDYLRISGSRSFVQPSGNTSYYNMEIETGRFDRHIFFPDTPIDKDNPRVQYINGILRIAFPLGPIVERIIPVQ
ncbi:MAG: Hsp20/alpha crystallin family protein [Candidatus Cloacimonetes bacterium]|nr:Hsp20/alpha crystallin family protein [Candidatus Cloacimonadota bacterium]NLO12446.1 Hsp20/alpha crystallin family protein [Candidatus Cloacimonadota bacterium]